MFDPLFFFLGCTVGGLAVALGAFGSHGLRRRTSLELMATFETGVRYQMYHAFALLAVSAVIPGTRLVYPVIAGWMFTAGILAFSGSLYLLVLTGRRWLGAVTPLGGVLLMGGWFFLALSALV